MQFIFKNISTKAIVIICFFILAVLFQSQSAYAKEFQLEDLSLPNLSLDQDEKKKTFSQADIQNYAFVAALAAATPGPSKVNLIDQGTLNLPKGYLFIPAKEATDFMKAMGNDVSANFIGLVVPQKDTEGWYITINYIKAGHIDDAEAKVWDADELFNTIKKNTEEANVENEQHGISRIEIIGWVQRPTYDSESHQLIWSLQAKQADYAHLTINYNTYALGREGYFKLDLVTSDEFIDNDKRHAKKILSSLMYGDGKRYEDFVAGKDHLAEYGLAALVAGAGAKKLGLFALAAVFIAKIWKLIALGCIVFFSTIKKIFNCKSK